jgi:hypothetical protein
MKTILVVLSLCLSTVLFGQDYQTAVGVRGGFGYGVTVKHFINSQDALEGILSSRWQGLLVTGLYERHADAFNTKGLFWFY